MTSLQMTATLAVPEWNVSDRLRKAREYAGLGVAEFADEIGVSRRTVSRYENEPEATPPKSVVLLWQMRTGISAEWILTGCAPRDLNPEPTDSGSGRVIAFPVRVQEVLVAA